MLMSVLLSIEQPLQIFNTEAHYNGTVNGGEGLAVEPADILAEPRFVYRSDLFEQDGGFGLETACYYRYMGGQSRFCLSACDRRHDGGGAVLVASIILQNQNRTNAALLTAEAYAEVGGIDFASFNLFHS